MYSLVRGKMKTSIVFSEKCLQYGSWHVESPARVRRVAEILKDQGYEFLKPEPASEDDILRVHDGEYVWMVKKGMVEDADTPAYENIFDYASLSAGGAILAAKTNGFSIMRPPGHHAGVFGAALGVPTRGFCYFNNVAIAVECLNKPTLILDVDGHHGNGTQEVFLGKERVTYVSLHRHPHYPGTGYSSEKNCLNFPLPADCGDNVYLKTLNEALSKVDMSEIELVAVSAGFDTHAEDLASLGLTAKGYREIGKRIGALERPTFFVLEGGYAGDNVGEDINQLLKGKESTSE
jgi:acetoin utilization deacetylase AcuC-like enzyme